MYTLKFDGLFRQVGDPAYTKTGLMSYGWLIYKGTTLLGKGRGAFAKSRDATSNVAEYLALIEGLEGLIDLRLQNESIRIIGDSQIVINQVSGRIVTTAPRLRQLRIRALKLLDQFNNVTLIWVSRKHNKDADALTRLAIRDARQNDFVFQMAINKLQAPPEYRPRQMLVLSDLIVYNPVIPAVNAVFD
jgi:ribonuclease HI